MSGEQRKARNKTYYEANKATINQRRREALLVPSKRDAVNRRQREYRAASGFTSSPDVGGTSTLINAPLAMPKGPVFNGVEGCRDNMVRLPRPCTVDERMLILPRISACGYCGAYKFYKEMAHFCCSAGQVSIATHVLPEYLVSPLTGQGDDSKDFHNMLRTYNNHFAYSSMSIHCDTQLQQRNHGIYTVRAQGQIHHFLNDLVPANPISLTSGLHFYFYDPMEQVAARTATLPRLKPSTVKGLVTVMEPNPYSSFLRTLSSLEELDSYCIVIKTDSTLDQRVYNKPTSTQVAGIWLEDETGSSNSYQRDIRIYARSGHNHNIQYYYACYDPLQYVLMFPGGEPGWHGNIPTVGSVLAECSSTDMAGMGMVDNNQPCSLDALFASKTTGNKRSNKRYKQSDSAGPSSIVRTNIAIILGRFLYCILVCCIPHNLLLIFRMRFS